MENINSYSYSYSHIKDKNGARRLPLSLQRKFASKNREKLAKHIL